METADAATRTGAARRGASWLATKQAANGTYGTSRADYVADTLVAAVAGGVRRSTIDRSLNYIEDNGEADATRGAFAGRIVAGLVAAEQDPADFRGTDFVAILAGLYDEEAGAWETASGEFYSNLEAVNGWLAAEQDLSDEALAYIVDNVCPDGGFSFERTCSRGADVDTTALAINILVELDTGDAVVENARDWLLDVQHSDGGFGFVESIQTSSDSTGLALSAINALGEDPQAAPWRSNGKDPVTKLMKMQTDEGWFKTYTSSKTANVASTKNAIPGLAGFRYPVREGLPPRSKPKPTDEPRRTRAPADDPDEPIRTDEPDTDDTPAPKVGARSGSGDGGGRSKTTRGDDDARDDAPRARRVIAENSPTPLPMDKAESFRRPIEAADSASSDGLPGVVVWGGIAVIAAGIAFGLGYQRRRS